MTIARVNILGVGISAVNMDIALERIEKWIARQESHYVCVAPVHSVMECQRDPGLRRILNTSGMTTPDGMPLVWLTRLRGFPHVSRVYGPDLMLALSERSVQRGYRHFFYGGADGVPDMLGANLCQRFPGLNVVGSYSPPFRPLTPGEESHVFLFWGHARPTGVRVDYVPDDVVPDRAVPTAYTH